MEEIALSLDLSIRVGELGRGWHIALRRESLRWFALGGGIVAIVGLTFVYEIWSSARIYPEWIYQTRKSASNQSRIERLKQDAPQVEEDVATMDSVRTRLIGRFGLGDGAKAIPLSKWSDARVLEELFPDPTGEESWVRLIDDMGQRASAARSSMEKNVLVAKQRVAKLEETPSIAPARGQITSGFGWRLHPILGEYMMHAGQDVSGPVGIPVVATATGKVVTHEYSSSFGNYVVLDHGGGVHTLYAHMSAFRCAMGQTVHRGEEVGLLGTTGRSTGPHVHYEVHLAGKPVDPLPWILPTTLVP